MNQPAQKLIERANTEGYAGDPFITDCLDTATQLEGQVDRLEKQLADVRANAPKSQTPLLVACGVVAAVCLVATIVLGFRVSADSDKIATLSAQNAAVTEKNAEATRDLKTLSDQLTKSVAAATAAVTEAAKATSSANDSQKSAAELYKKMIDVSLNPAPKPGNEQPASDKKAGKSP